MPALNLDGTFELAVEVVPPAGPDPGPLLQALRGLHGLPFAAFSVATNPLAKPRLSALALSALIQREVGRPAILHCTTRDHNRLSLQALLWGARALGIETVLVATGDFVALGDQARTTTVRDVDVFGLVRMAREAGLQTGVVLDPHPEANGLEQAVQRLCRKAEAGAQFAVTQPVYNRAGALALAEATASVDLPVFLGILPLRSARHAQFLHDKVAGIGVPEAVRQRMAEAVNPAAEGVMLAREMLRLAREQFAGAFLMPPFDRYEVVAEVLGP